MDEYLSKKIRVLGFVAILMVVLLHSYNVDVRFRLGSESISQGSWAVFLQSLISGSLTRVAVPMFFLFSGYLFFFRLQPSPAEFARKIARRSLTLGVPYLLWSCLGLVSFFLMQAVPFAKDYFTTAPVADLTPGQLVAKVFVDPVPYQLWFVQELMKYVVMSPLIFFALSRFGLGSLFAVGILWYCGLWVPHLRLVGLFFFLLGGYLAIKNVPIDVRLRGSFWLVLLWIGTAVLDTLLAFRYHTRVAPLHNLSVLVGLAAIWTTFDAMAGLAHGTREWTVTAYTFFIYASHEPLLTVTKKAWIGMFGSGEVGNVVAYFLCPAIVVFTSVVVASVLRTRVGWLYWALTGGRGYESDPYRLAKSATGPRPDFT